MTGLIDKIIRGLFRYWIYQLAVSIVVIRSTKREFNEGRHE